jgi:PKD repeat protein
LTYYAFDSSGVYQVQLIVKTYNGCRDTFEKQMEILPSPKAAISINDSAQCFNQNSFTFLNPWGFGNPKGLKMWDFGDGKTSNSDTAIHSYANADTFQIILIEETDKGCKDTAKRDVVVHPSPKAHFNINDTNQCFNENRFELINLSTCPKSMGYQWDFGDLSQSTDSNYIKSYSKVDTFSIQLIATTADGCPDTMVKKVVVLESPKAFFELNDSSQCFKNNNCVFNNLSTTSYNSRLIDEWHFGDGVISNNPNPEYEYNEPDTFDVMLVVFDSNHCRGSFTKKVYIHPVPQPGIQVNDSIQCENENLFVLEDTTRFAYSDLTRIWELSDNTIETEKTFNHTFLSDSTYILRLKLESEEGCTNVLEKTLTVHPSPKAEFSHEQPCLDIPNQFNDQSTIDASGTINQWIWNFDDGNSETVQNPVHTFNTSGYYDVQLIAISSDGCPDTNINQLYFFEHVIPNELERATVQNDENILIEWNESPQGNPQWFILEKSLDNAVFKMVDSFEKSERSFTDKNVDVDKQQYWYRLQTIDHCKHQSGFSNIGKAVLLGMDSSLQYPVLNWTPYLDWPSGVSFYTLEIFNDE